MTEYHKIQTVWERNRDTKFKTLVENKWTTEEFEFLKDNEWEFTEKVDGTNIRVIWDSGNISYFGKTDNSQIPATLVNKLRNIFTPLQEKMTEICPDGQMVLYGEGYGPNIQKAGKLYRNDQDFVLFDIKIGEWWLKRDSIEDIGQKLELDVVPVIGTGSLFDMIEMTKNGIKSTWGDFNAEGIVARPVIPLFDRSGSRIITKIKTKDFQ